MESYVLHSLLQEIQLTQTHGASTGSVDSVINKISRISSYNSDSVCTSTFNSIFSPEHLGYIAGCQTFIRAIDQVTAIFTIVF